MHLCFFRFLFSGVSDLSFYSYSFALTKRAFSVRIDLNLTDGYGDHDHWESRTIQQLR